MATAQVEADIGYVMSEVTSRIRNLENKYNLLGERVLIINKNMIEEYRKIIKEIRIINTELGTIKRDIVKTSEVTKNVVKEMEHFAKKEQIQVLEKYIDLWNPLKFTTEQQVEQLIDEKMKKKVKKGE